MIVDGSGDGDPVPDSDPDFDGEFLGDRLGASQAKYWSTFMASFFCLGSAECITGCGNFMEDTYSVRDAKLGTANHLLCLFLLCSDRVGISLERDSSTTPVLVCSGVSFLDLWVTGQHTSKLASLESSIQGSIIRPLAEVCMQKCRLHDLGEKWALLHHADQEDDVVLTSVGVGCWRASASGLWVAAIAVWRRLGKFGPLGLAVFAKTLGVGFDVVNEVEVPRALPATKKAIVLIVHLE